MPQLGLYPRRKLSTAELFSILQAKLSDAETVNCMNSRSSIILCRALVLPLRFLDASV